MATGEKAPGAFKTIGELSSELGVAQHILRYWESKFPQLARTIHRLLNSEGYTVRGVQKVLRSKDPAPAPQTATVAVGDATVAVDKLSKEGNGVDVGRLKAVRHQLAALLED